MVLLAATFISDEQVKRPLTRTVCWVLDPAALASADALVTVTVGPLPPPVVPPDWVDQPSWLYVAANALGMAARPPPTASARTAAPTAGPRQRRGSRLCSLVDMGASGWWVDAESAFLGGGNDIENVRCRQCSRLPRDGGFARSPVDHDHRGTRRHVRQQCALP